MNQTALEPIDHTGTKRPWDEFVSAPLGPVAVAVTVGLTLDRYLSVPTGLGLSFALYFVVYAFRQSKPTKRQACLYLGYAALAAAYHHAWTKGKPSEAIVASISPEPSLLRIRGYALEDANTKEQTQAKYGQQIVLRSRVFLFQILELAAPDGWASADGIVRVHLNQPEEAPTTTEITQGDLLECVGWFRSPGPPDNPGMPDPRRWYQDRRISGDFYLDSESNIRRLAEARLQFSQLPLWIRRYGNTKFESLLPEQEAATAQALILGDGSRLDQNLWDVYIRTGVVHVLAISGQHFAIVAVLLWWVCRCVGVRRFHAAWAVLFVLAFYVIVTGMRPSAVRAFVMAGCFCGSIIVRRPLHRANAFCAAWIAVIILNPTDPFTLGCRFSFLSVFALIWLAEPWLRGREKTPLELLIDESRGPLERAIRTLACWIGTAFLLSAFLQLLNAPLLIFEQHSFAPVALLIGPLILLCTTIGLVSGLLCLVLSAFGLEMIALYPLQYSLELARWLVVSAEVVPGAVLTMPGLPLWWVFGFYTAFFFSVLFRISLSRRILAAWLLGLGLPWLWWFYPNQTNECSVTILAVGRGGCTVIETPDGRCLIYDAGSTLGPQIIRRVLVPYLASRSVRRIDELLISHADSDHFNGIEELARRYPLGLVSLTPSFAEKPTWEVEAALTTLQARNVASRLLFAGMLLDAGPVRLQVLHPPKVGPPGTENERSLVLLLQHLDHRILLTGDLEKRGLEMVTQQALVPVDVVTAPHHGSRAATPRVLFQWCQPKFVAVSRGQPYGNTINEQDVPPGCLLRDTNQHGAITIRSGSMGLLVHCFRSQEQFRIR